MNFIFIIKFIMFKPIIKFKKFELHNYVYADYYDVSTSLHRIIVLYTALSVIIPDYHAA